MTPLMEIIAWTALTFVVGIVLDMVGQYKIQLAYIAPPGKPALTARFRTRPGVRHLVIFAIACCIQFAHRSNVSSMSAEIVVMTILLLVYAVMLVRDAIHAPEIEEESD